MAFVNRPFDDDLLDQGRLRPLDEIDQLIRCFLSHFIGILAECSELGLDMTRDAQSVVAADGNVIRNGKSPIPDCIETAICGKIIRVQNTGRRIFQVQKFVGLLFRLLRGAVRCFLDVIIRNIEPELHCSVVEAEQAAVGYARPQSMDIGDPAVSLIVNICQQITHAPDIVRHDSCAVVKHVVNGNDRNVAADKLDNLGIIEIDTGYADTVKTSVARMRQIGHSVRSRPVVIDKGDIVAF